MIRAKEAYDDKNALQTVIDGKRPLCWICISKQTFTLNGEEYCITSGIDNINHIMKTREDKLKELGIL